MSTATYAARAADLTSVVYADLVGFTSFAEVHDDTVVTEVLDVFDIAIKEHAARYAMDVVKGLGDAFLLRATDAANALTFSTSLVREMDRRAAPLALHIGVHAGPVIERNDDIFGKTVNLAGRLASLARPDEILVTRAALSARRAIAGATPVFLGEQRIRGIPGPVGVYSLRATNSAAPTDPVCRMKVPPDTGHTATVFRHTYRFCSAGCAAMFAQRPAEFFDAMLRRRLRRLSAARVASEPRAGGRRYERDTACAITGF